MHLQIIYLYAVFPSSPSDTQGFRLEDQYSLEKNYAKLLPWQYMAPYDHVQCSNAMRVLAVTGSYAVMQCACWL